MARPQYMLCCERRIFDRETGLVTYVNAIDKIMAFPPGAQPPPAMQAAAAPRLCVSAVWAHDPNDPQGPWEWEMLVSYPGGAEPQPLGSGTFESTTPIRRFDVTLLPQPPAGGGPQVAGEIRFTSRMRPVGASEWQSQICVIPVEVAPTANPEQRAPEASA